MAMITKLISSGIILLFTISAFPADEEISKDQVPSAVLKSFSNSFPDAIAQSYAAVTRNDGTCYEIESTEEKISGSYVYDSNGTLIEFVEKIPSDALPAPVQDSINSTHNKISFMIAERIFKDNRTTYSVLLDFNTSIEVKFFNPDGSITNNPNGSIETQDESGN
jgi:hypothetical protein